MERALSPPRVDRAVLARFDELTLQRARRGDRSALAHLVRHYQGRVYALASRVLAGRLELVPDTAQEALVKIVRGISGFRASGDHQRQLDAWVARVTTRACYDALRTRWVKSWDSTEVAPVSAANVEAEVGDRELGRHVERAMAELPVEQRTALVLRAFHDLDYSEIANIQGVEIGTAKSRVARARQALARLLRARRVR
jgi:RNA polymerase sigma-70 factor (ECF subfamily)